MTVILASFHHIGNWTVLVGLHLAVLAIPYYEEDPAYDRNKRDENPPSALAYVVKASNGDAEIWEQKGKTYESAYDAHDVLVPAEYYLHYYSENEGKEIEPPEFGARCAAAEIAVVLLDGALHCFLECDLSLIHVEKMTFWLIKIAMERHSCQSIAKLIKFFQLFTLS